MFTLKVIDYFRTLNPEEFLEFGKFLNSPIFNSVKPIIKFYDNIKDYYPIFAENDVDPKTIYHKIYGWKSPYKEKTLFNLSTQLTSLFESFLIYLEHRNEPFYSKKFLFQQLQKRNLTRLFEKNLEITAEILDNLKYKDEDYYLNKFMLETLRREFYVNHISFTKLKDEFKKHDEELDNIIFFFTTIMMKEYMHIHNYASHINYHPEYKFYDEIMNYIHKNENTFKNEKLVYLFVNFIKIYDEKYDPSLLEKLKILLSESKDYIKRDVFNFLYVDLYNYCKDQEELGRKEYGYDSLKLMDIMLKSDVLVKTDGYLSANTYTNIVSNALRENQIEWAKNLIDEYKEKVKPDDRENAYQYALGIYFYVLGNNKNSQKDNFKTALYHLSKVKTEDYGYMSGVKDKQIDIYYYFEDFDSAMAIIDSYKHYLAKNKSIPGDSYERIANYLKVIDKLIKIRMGSKFHNLGSLKEEIMSYKTIDSRKWFLREIEELEKKEL